MSKIIKKALSKIGQNTTGHAFRCLFITTLANDPGVSVVESMASTRHGSAAAQKTYIVRDGKSESAKFEALGIRKKGAWRERWGQRVDGETYGYGEWRRIIWGLIGWIRRRGTGIVDLGVGTIG